MLNNVEIEISGFKYKYHPIKQLAIDIYGYDSRTMVSEYSFHNYITLYGLYYHPLFKNITYMGTRTNFDNVTIELKDQIKNSVDLELKKIFLNCKSTILEKLFNRFRENRPNNKKLATIAINCFESQTAFSNVKKNNLIMMDNTLIKKYCDDNKDLKFLVENNFHKTTKIIDWQLYFSDIHVIEKKSFFDFMKF